MVTSFSGAKLTYYQNILLSSNEYTKKISPFVQLFSIFTVNEKEWINHIHFYLLISLNGFFSEVLQEHTFMLFSVYFYKKF